jgi:hypothetical protein
MSVIIITVRQRVERIQINAYNNKLYIINELAVFIKLENSLKK